MVTPQQFFFIIAAGAFISWLVCWLWLVEPEGGFSDEYVISSVDKAIAREAQQRKQTEADVSLLLQGSGKVELLDKGDGLQLTARFRDVEELRQVVDRLSPRAKGAT